MSLGKTWIINGVVALMLFVAGGIWASAFNISLSETALSLLIDTFNMIGTLALATVAILSLHQWRKQHAAIKNAERAENILSEVLPMKTELSSINYIVKDVARRPVPESGVKQNSHRLYYKNKAQEITDKIYNLMDIDKKISVEIHLFTGVISQAREDTLSCLNEIINSLSIMQDSYTVSELMGEPEYRLINDALDKASKLSENATKSHNKLIDMLTATAHMKP